MSDIFISYARSDRDTAQSLAHALQHHGWTVWWDREIVPGSVFERTIEEALDNAACMIVLWSERAAASDWVRAEMEEGRKRGIVIPTRLDNAQFPLPIRQIQSCDLSAWQGGVDGADIEELLQAVTYITTRSPARGDAQPEAVSRTPSRSAPAAAPRRRRRNPILLALAALVGVGAVLSVAAAVVWMPKSFDATAPAAPAATSTSSAGKVAISIGLYEGEPGQAGRAADSSKPAAAPTPAALAAAPARSPVATVSPSPTPTKTALRQLDTALAAAPSQPEAQQTFGKISNYQASGPTSPAPPGPPTLIPVRDASSNPYIFVDGYLQSRIPYVLTYSYDIVDNTVVIAPKMPYRDLLLQGGPIFNWGIESSVRDAFTPAPDRPDYLINGIFPTMSIKAVNNTSDTVYLSEIVVRVKASKIDTEPLVSVHASGQPDHRGAAVFLHNAGWGQMLHPVVSMGITRVRDCMTEGPVAGATTAYQLNSVDVDSQWVGISFADPVLPEESTGCVFGTVAYDTEEGNARSVQYRNFVSFVPLPGSLGAIPLQAIYGVTLEAGRSDYTVRIPISESLKPGDAGHFGFRIMTDKSASFDMSISFRAVGAADIDGGDLLLGLIVPRPLPNVKPMDDPQLNISR